MSTLRVEHPGLFTTLQDLGRPGQRAAGVPPGGAMDRFAISAANVLVGNSQSAGALECALSGPTLVADGPCLIAVTGADFGPLLNGSPMPSWTGVFMAAGDRWLGSVATYLLVGRGGMHGRPLAGGDRLELDRIPDLPVVSGRHLPEGDRPGYAANPLLGAIPGPHASRLSKDSRRNLYGEAYVVSRDADRMGYRLEGPVLELRGPELISFGLTAGCLQVPQSGQPILLMADHQTAGGYPVPTVVCRADLSLAAQLLPGDSVSFQQITVDEAQRRHRRLREALDSLKSR